MVKTAAILLDLVAEVVQFNDRSMGDDNGNTQQSNSTREKGGGRWYEWTNEQTNK